MSAQIEVAYPIVEEEILRTAKEMKALGYREKAQIAYHAVNRPQQITVKKLSRRVQEEFMTAEDYEAELVALCVAQTGMTPSKYQAKHKRAWND
jgi:hypothetical protein